MTKNKIFFCVVSILISLTGISCLRQEKPRVTSKDELYFFLNTLERRYESACANVEIARWDKLVNKESDNLTVAKSDLAEIFLDTSTQNIIGEWLHRANSLADENLTRRLQLWHRVFIGGSIQFDPEILLLQNSLRYSFERLKYKFKNNRFSNKELTAKILNEKKQIKRKNLWQAKSEIPDTINKDFIRLIQLRNKRASGYGFPNYYSLILYLEAINEDWLLKTLQSLGELTQNDYNKLVLSLKKRLHIKNLTPWDIEFAQKDNASLPDRYFPADSLYNVLQYFENRIGFNTDSPLIKIDVMTAPYPAELFTVNIPHDVRLILGLRAGGRSYSSAFREYSRAVRAAHINVEYPILKGYNIISGSYSPSFEEGIAQMQEELFNDSLWLVNFTKAKGKEISSYLSKRNFSTLLQLREELKEFFTEYEIYKNPDQDLDSLKGAMFHKFLLGSSGDSGNYSFPFTLSYISSPGIFYKPILRELIAAQLSEALLSKFGHDRISNPKIASWMIEYLYLHGETIEWHKRIFNATGKSLEPGAYLRKLGIEQTTMITTNK